MLVCRFVGLIFRALGQPTVIGEIIAGAVRAHAFARVAARAGVARSRSCVPCALALERRGSLRLFPFTTAACVRAGTRAPPDEPWTQASCWAPAAWGSHTPARREAAPMARPATRTTPRCYSFPRTRPSPMGHPTSASASCSQRLPLFALLRAEARIAVALCGSYLNVLAQLGVVVFMCARPARSTRVFRTRGAFCPAISSRDARQLWWAWRWTFRR